MKVTNAMERIESLYQETKGQCYLSFSGGKDSTVILTLIKLCEELYTIPQGGIPAVYCDTRIELDATTKFVNWCKDHYYSNIKIIYPRISFQEVLIKYGKPLRSKMKSGFLYRYQHGNETSKKYLLGSDEQNYQRIKLANKDMHFIHPNFPIDVSNKCCDFLKKKPFEKYNKENNIKGYILGERIDEGGARALAAHARLKRGGSLCTKTKGNYIVKLPIVDWSDNDIDEFIQKYNMPLSDAYTVYGLERTGCVGCPFSLQLDKNLKSLYYHESNKYRATLAWLKDVYIAQGTILPFDKDYEVERRRAWEKDYIIMRKRMLMKYRPQVNVFAKRYTDIKEGVKNE